MPVTSATSEDLEALRRSAKRLLATHASSAQVRAAMATEAGWEPAVWALMARELGWAALAIPEEDGGVGAGWEAVAALFEETGKALLCAPLFSTVCLGASAIVECGDRAQRSALLPPLVEGVETATLAVTERNGAWDPADVEATAERTEHGWTLRGTKRYVVDGHSANAVIVAAREPGSVGAEGLGLYVVRSGARGLERRAVGTMDLTRKLAEITLRDVAVGKDARLDRGDWGGLERVLHRACVALSAEEVGGAARCLEMSVEYAKVRTQFGRPIGSFQAIKHKCADMLVDVESARSASYEAARIASSVDRAARSADAPSGVDEAELGVAAMTAKAFCSEAFLRTAGEAIQVHGGVGFTWEHDAHLLFKRAKGSMQLLGDAAHHRDVLARRIGFV
ncbi:MAG TPA: acyl-CoA dehydrogenase family protein [Polyangiaceae bacterium]